MKNKIDPELDGVTHINVYSKGKTSIGRLLTNWAPTPFVTEEHGAFRSLEGYIFWLGGGDERLRKLSGWEAKQLGAEVSKGKPRMSKFEFTQHVAIATKAKLQQNPDLTRLWREAGELPLKHYYVYGDKVVTVPGWDWQVSLMERTLMGLE